jgi:hypothetical protein
VLIGTAEVERLARNAPSMESLQGEALTLERLEILQMTYEIAASAREALLPPALHPTNPPILTWLFYRATDGPLGSFAMAQARIGCRSGVRPRAFLAESVIDGAEAAAVLAARWGYRSRPGKVDLERRYDAIVGRVTADGRVILEVSLFDPEPLAAPDVQYVANMNLARTPMGLRLVQVDPEHRIDRAERGRPRLLSFDAEAWGDVRMRPVHPISGSIAVGDVKLPRLRYVCRPDVLAFTGTEAVR